MTAESWRDALVKHVSAPSAAAHGVDDERCGSGSPEVAVVEPCAQTPTVSSHGGVTIMMHTASWFFNIFFSVSTFPHPSCNPQKT